MFRSAQNLSQEQLAEIAGIISNFIFLVECNDTNPSIIKLLQIANALNVELSELVITVGHRSG